MRTEGNRGVRRDVRRLACASAIVKADRLRARPGSSPTREDVRLASPSSALSYAARMFTGPAGQFRYSSSPDMSAVIK